MRHKTKRQFHCQHCASPCDIYKKGKTHRVLVCPNCGVLATNPTLAGKILRGAVGSIPIVGGVAEAIVGGIQDKKSSKATPPTAPAPIQRDNKERYKYKEFLMQEALYGGHHGGNN